MRGRRRRARAARYFCRCKLGPKVKTWERNSSPATKKLLKFSGRVVKLQISNLLGDGVPLVTNSAFNRPSLGRVPRGSREPEAHRDQRRRLRSSQAHPG